MRATMAMSGEINRIKVCFTSEVVCQVLPEGNDGTRLEVGLRREAPHHGQRRAWPQRLPRSGPGWQEPGSQEPLLLVLQVGITAVIIILSITFWTNYERRKSKRGRLIKCKNAKKHRSSSNIKYFFSISDASVILQSKFIIIINGIIILIIVITSLKVFSWRSGPITAMIGTDRQGYVPGELIGFSAEVVWFDKRIYKHLNQNSDSNLKNCFRLTTKVTDWWQNLICIWLRWIWLIFIF